MELKTMRTIFKVTAIAGVPITGFLAARGGKTKAEKLLNGEPYETKAEKFVLNANSYGPAIISGAVTITSIVLADYFGAKELAAAGALAAGIAANKNKVKEQFEKYRNVVKEEDGEARDVDIMQKASKVRFDDDGEVIHTYRLDFLDDPIYVESTARQMGEALSRVNKELCDYVCGTGIVTVTDVLKFLNHPELETRKTNIAGWSQDLLAVECDCYFLDWLTIKAGESAWYKDENPDVIVVSASWGPYPDLQKALDRAHEIGTI